MLKQIPEDFKMRMIDMLGNEFEAFWQSYANKSHHGLRVNLLKLSVNQFLPLTDFQLEPIPWCPSGFYYTENDRPGKHPYHSAGLYYIQEPSAMSIVEFLAPQPGEVVLDLCAAPGGKSTHIASCMQGDGFLVSNEIHTGRAKALSENIERFGVKNALVTNETPDRLAKRFPIFFDRILVDAPCSGEGMFRKLEEACEDWSWDKVEHCTVMQEEILDAAADMLKPGGLLVYSTCTFNAEENEKQISRFLSKQPEFELEPLAQQEGIAPGRPEWAEGDERLLQTARLWPHLLRGEGHYAACLRKKNGEEQTSVRSLSPRVDKQAIQLFEAFAKEFLQTDILEKGKLLMFGEQLYLAPLEMPDLAKLKVVRPGWHLGTLKKGRFEPSHALALGLRSDEVKQSISFAPEHPDVERYIRGESLMVNGELKGWTLLCVNGFPLGWGKISNGQLKNHYPKGLRWV